MNLVPFERALELDGDIFSFNPPSDDASPPWSVEELEKPRFVKW